jgi:hypothetical protein
VRKLRLTEVGNLSKFTLLTNTEAGT